MIGFPTKKKQYGSIFERTFFDVSRLRGKRNNSAMNILLDTFVDRFGTRDAIYTNDGDNYFTARVTVSVSEQFFGWLCGLGNKVKIEAPQSVKNEYAEYLTKILKLHT